MTTRPIEPSVTVTELNQQTTAVLRRVKAGKTMPITERGQIIAYLTPPPPTITGNPVIDGWIAEGRLLPQAVPGTVLDLLPLPDTAPGDDEVSLSRAVLDEREREAGE
jgi:antitoxin (DNA-binding transcriptional repressor) of toxin-antitoxin stability system